MSNKPATDTWEIQIATPDTQYVRHTVTNRFWSAWEAFEELQVTSGGRKRLRRNGRVINEEVKSRTVEQVLADELFALPIAN